MDNSINFELALVLVAVFVSLLAIIYLSQKSRRRNKRIQQDYETLALAKQIGCDIRDPDSLRDVGLPDLHVNKDGDEVIAAEVKTIILFIIGMLLVFGGIVLYLFNQQSIGLAITTVLFAIAGAVYLGKSIEDIKKSGQALLQLKQQVADYENNFDQIAAEKKTSATATGTSSVTAKYWKPLDELLQLAEKFSDVVPQDSALRRHFMTQLLTTTEEALGKRPTDSTLKRHYDQLLDSKLVQALEEPAVPGAVQQVVVTERVVVAKPRVPEDSTLRRHFLTELRFKLEDRLGMPRPTDFNLRRHYESLLQSLLEKELEEHYS